MHNYVKTLMTKAQLLEEMIRTATLDYATKSSQTQLFDSCLGQITDIKLVAESSVAKSVQAQQTVELLMQALHEMSGSSTSISLEYLNALSR
jgi:hypothetical protein